MNIRLATPEDGCFVRNIYSEYIDTPVTFECALPSVDDFALRIKTTLTDYPYLIAEEDGIVIGYAYDHRQRERKAYDWNSELSVYVDNNHISKGAGTVLYSALMDILKLCGIVTVYGAVTMPNVKSEALHKKLGFNLIGIFGKTGYKCGEWLDVAWFEKQLTVPQNNPEPITPFSEIPMEQIYAVLKKYGV